MAKRRDLREAVADGLDPWTVLVVVVVWQALQDYWRGSLEKAAHAFVWLVVGALAWLAAVGLTATAWAEGRILEALLAWERRRVLGQAVLPALVWEAVPVADEVAGVSLATG